VSDRLHPLSLERLTAWIADELAAKDSIFGIPRQLFFRPGVRDRFRTTIFGHELETPIGVAAGPHSQMAGNIVAAWLCGARFIELKTVQTLDGLESRSPASTCRTRATTSSGRRSSASSSRSPSTCTPGC
jgi:putative selenate reductase